MFVIYKFNKKVIFVLNKFMLIVIKWIIALLKRLYFEN